MVSRKNASRSSGAIRSYSSPRRAVIISLRDTVLSPSLSKCSKTPSIERGLPALHRRRYLGSAGRHSRTFQRATLLKRFVVGWPVLCVVALRDRSARATQLPCWIHEMNSCLGFFALKHSVAVIFSTYVRMALSKRIGRAAGARKIWESTGFIRKVNWTPPITRSTACGRLVERFDASAGAAL